MDGAEGDVDGLVFGNQAHLVVDGDPGGAFDDDPVFGAVVVALQAEGGAGVDDDALDLKAVADDEAFVPAPRPVVAGEGFGLRHAGGFQDRNGEFYVLSAVFGGDQNGVGHGDGDDVVQTDADQLQAARLGAQQAVGAINRQGVAMGYHAQGVLG